MTTNMSTAYGVHRDGGGDVLSGFPAHDQNIPMR